MLEKDINIYSKGVDIEPHLVLSSGSYFIEIPQSYHGYSYKGYAPLEPWRLPKTSDLSMLIASNPSDENSNTIGLGKISKELLFKSKILNIYSISSEEELGKIEQSPQFKTYVLELFSYFKPIIIKEEGLAGPVLSFRFPHNLKTATTNKHKKTYLGLHMDSWDTYPWHQRHLARNRICLNLGEEMRYFLFINLSAQKIISMIETKLKRTLESFGAVYLPHLFFDCFSYYEVIKIGLEPGEYYIAPTENMIHDSTMIGKKKNDIFLTFWGNFRPNPI